MLEIKHLITLQKIQQQQSLAQAAVELKLTPSALSHQLKQIEDYFNCKLLKRKSKPPLFSYEGKKLLKLAAKILPEYLHTIAELQPQNRQHQRLFIALECHSCYQWLLPTIMDFRQDYANVETDLLSEFNFNPIPQLLSQDLDIVITGDPQSHPNISYIPLFGYEMKVGVALINPLAQKPYIKASDLVNETLLTYPVENDRLTIIQFLKSAGLEAKQVRKAELTLMHITLAASNQGISCLPIWAYDEYPMPKSIKLLSMNRHGNFQSLYVACLKTRSHCQLIQGFIQIAKRNSQLHLRNISPI